MTATEATPSTDLGDPRRVLGDLVRQLMGRRHVDKAELAQRAQVSRSTVWRLMVGDPNVTVETISAVEQALGQPFGLFGFVAAGNVRAIEAMPGLDENIRSWIVCALDTRPAVL